MKLIVNPSHFNEFLKQGYSLDYLFILKMIEDKVDIRALSNGSSKFLNLLQGLERKGLITEDDKLTTLAKDLIEFIESKGKRVIKVKTDVEGFDEWWNEWPGNDGFTYKGKTFRRTRSIKASESDCRAKFDKIILEGKYTFTQLINALKCELHDKREESVRKGENQMKYMPAPLTYLNKERYVGYINAELPTSVESENVTFGTEI